MNWEITVWMDLLLLAVLFPLVCWGGVCARRSRDNLCDHDRLPGDPGLAFETWETNHPHGRAIRIQALDLQAAPAVQPHRAPAP
jgi:hypothetical protein